jgi:hypothetical protein
VTDTAFCKNLLDHFFIPSPLRERVGGVKVNLFRAPSNNNAQSQYAVAAPRTPDVREFLFVPPIFVNKLGDFGHGFSFQQTAVSSQFFVGGHCPPI